MNIEGIEKRISDEYEIERNVYDAIKWVHNSIHEIGKLEEKGEEYILCNNNRTIKLLCQEAILIANLGVSMARPGLTIKCKFINDEKREDKSDGYINIENLDTKENFKFNMQVTITRTEETYKNMKKLCEEGHINYGVSDYNEDVKKQTELAINRIKNKIDKKYEDKEMCLLVGLQTNCKPLSYEQIYKIQNKIFEEFKNVNMSFPIIYLMDLSYHLSIMNINYRR